MKKLAPLLLFVVFTLYTTVIAVHHGLFGFITLALREPWAGQLLLDLAISLVFVGAWLRRDARTRGIDARPYLVGLALLGSISTLAYLVHRSLKSRA